MNLAKDVPGIRGIGESRVRVESLAKDGVEVGSGYKDAVEVESFGDGSLAENGAEVGSGDEDVAEVETLAEDRVGVSNLTEDMPGVGGLEEASAGIGTFQRLGSHGPEPSWQRVYGLQILDIINFRIENDFYPSIPESGIQRDLIEDFSVPLSQTQLPPLPTFNKLA